MGCNDKFNSGNCIMEVEQDAATYTQNKIPAKIAQNYS